MNSREEWMYPTGEPRSGSKFAELLDFLINFSTAAIVFAGIYFFVAQPHQVEGGSMLPNYYDGDYVLTEKISKYIQGINRGDVVVFHYPQNPSIDYIKRVVALPGDEIMLSGGRIYINGVVAEEPYLEEAINTTGHSFLKEGQRYLVKEDELIVMGDNRLESSDSREWGGVLESLVLGKVFFRYWPPSRIGFMEHN